MSLIDNGHIAIFSTISLTVYSQLVVKWQMNLADDLPLGLWEKIPFFFHILINPWIISAIIATFFAGISWMMAMSKFDLSYAYPFVSLVYVLMMIFSVIFFHELITFNKVAGVVLISLGIIVLGFGS